ncbi:hypothetical protein [Legionella maioricensis]|uniref:Uncharacterized protein n=1 Tax=Legionella maioricensis TaxID=2896528 RepID=A0A9X2IAT4_9GAMM|nr:hypothetical protein [Legionella maioricensis]MCL9683855.1 hypothetical protein [Legionella maioricensis]MCL9686702.1 hypothetical protein [Legionella maioricensis]
MKNNNPVTPENILPEDINSTTINGTLIRKGTIAAFLANTEILESNNATEQQKQDAIQTMRELAPAVIAVGLHKHAVFKNTLVEEILIDAESC